MKKQDRDDTFPSNISQKQMVFELWDTMVGNTRNRGFIDEMRSFRKETEDRLDRFEHKLYETKNDINPIVKVITSWKMITAFFITFLGLLSTIVYIIIQIS